jgi:tetratricopeptide (TPR) repeat protein
MTKSDRQHLIDPQRLRGWTVACALGLACALPSGAWLPVWAQERADTEFYDLYISKGMFEYGRERYSQAEVFFRKALEQKPGDGEAVYYLGQCLLRQGKLEEAEKVFQALLASDPRSPRGWLGLGIVQYNRARYRDAETSLLEADKLAPDDSTVHYYLGLVHHAQGEFEKSQPQFRRAMTLSPDLAPSAHYYSGVAYFRRGMLDAARTEFEAVLASQPSPELGQSAREFMALTTASAPSRPKPWSLTASVSAEWDSNIVLMPSGVQPPAGTTGISRQGDYRTVLYARGEYRPVATERWNVGSSYGFYQSFHRTLSGFDVQDHSPTVFVQHQLGPIGLSLQYVYNYTLVGRAPYLIAQAVQPLLLLKEGANAYTQVEFRYQNKDFQHGRFTINAFRDGKNWLAGLTQFLLFSENQGRVWLGYTYDTDRTGGGSPSFAVPGEPTNADWSYQGHRIATGLELPPVRTLKLDLAFDYYLQEYDNPNSFSSNGLIRRKDNIYAFSANVSRGITENISAALQYAYTRDQNNIQAFDYNHSVYSLVLTGRF